MKTNNCTFDTKILWNEKSKTLESEDLFLEQMGKGWLDSYIKTKIARFFGTYKKEVSIIQNSVKWLVITIGEKKTEIHLFKQDLPKMLNETIFDTHRVKGQSN